MSGKCTAFPFADFPSPCPSVVFTTIDVALDSAFFGALRNLIIGVFCFLFITISSPQFLCIPHTSPVSGREAELSVQVMQLQQRVGSLVEELQRQKLKNAQLERQVNVFIKKDEKSQI